MPCFTDIWEYSHYRRNIGCCYLALQFDSVIWAIHDSNRSNRLRLLSSVTLSALWSCSHRLLALPLYPICLTITLRKKEVPWLGSFVGFYFHISFCLVLGQVHSVQFILTLRICSCIYARPIITFYGTTQLSIHYLADPSEHACAPALDFVITQPHFTFALVSKIDFDLCLFESPRVHVQHIRP